MTFSVHFEKCHILIKTAVAATFWTNCWKKKFQAIGHTASRYLFLPSTLSNDVFFLLRWRENTLIISSRTSFQFTYFFSGGPNPRNASDMKRWSFPRINFDKIRHSALASAASMALIYCVHFQEELLKGRREGGPHTNTQCIISG